MTLHRFFIPQPLPPGSTIALPPDRARQAVKVLRLRPGDNLVLFNGDGWDVACTLERVERDMVWVTVGEPAAGRPIPPPPIHLAPGILKGERFDWVVQKATELGVDRLTPLITERTVVSFADGRADARRERWRRIAVEAAEQCGRTTIPRIDEPLRLAGFLSEVRAGGAVAFWEGAPVTPLQSCLPPLDAPLLLLIGPEGGFTAEEVAALQVAGASAASLGPLILRSETAAIAAIAAVQALAAAEDPGYRDDAR